MSGTKKKERTHESLRGPENGKPMTDIVLEVTKALH